MMMKAKEKYVKQKKGETEFVADSDPKEIDGILGIEVKS